MDPRVPYTTCALYILEAASLGQPITEKMPTIKCQSPNCKVWLDKYIYCDVVVELQIQASYLHKLDMLATTRNGKSGANPSRPICCHNIEYSRK